MRTSFHHQPEAQHPNFQLSTSWQADYPIFRGVMRTLQQTSPNDRVCRVARRNLTPGRSQIRA
jgi:hypothetical protein